MDARQNTFDDALFRTMDRLIEMGKKKPAKSFFVKEKRLMYYSGWHRDGKPVTDDPKGKGSRDWFPRFQVPNHERDQDKSGKMFVYKYHFKWY